MWLGAKMLNELYIFFVKHRVLKTAWHKECLAYQAFQRKFIVLYFPFLMFWHIQTIYMLNVKYACRGKKWLNYVLKKVKVLSIICITYETKGFLNLLFLDGLTDLSEETF